MKTTLAIACVLCLFLLANGSCESFGLNSDIKGDSVVFQSPAKLEFIKGKSFTIEGGFEFDPANPTDSISGIIKVDLRLLRTGIETRDGHMRENHLETDKYPFAYFDIKFVSDMPEKLDSSRTYEVTARGWFYIHGVKREISPDIVFKYKPQTVGQPGSIVVLAKFDIKLEDYRIDRPKALFLKLAKTIEVDVQLTGYNYKPIPQISLPNWPAID